MLIFEAKCRENGGVPRRSGTVTEARCGGRGNIFSRRRAVKCGGYKSEFNLIEKNE